MRLLSKRRFPHTITRQRDMPGYRNMHGEYVDGTTVDTEMDASIQPMGIEDKDDVSGVNLFDRLNVYLPTPIGELVSPLRPGFVSATGDTSGEDRIIYNGITYRVTEAWPWGNYTKAIVSRQT